MRVVVLGAGYAGTTAANVVSRKVPDARITVVNPRAEFVERVRLHEHLASTGDAATAMSGMLRAGIELRVGEAILIEEGRVLLSGGGEVEFDFVLVAVGSTVAPLAKSIPVGTWEGAELARTSLAQLEDGAAVTVIGGGLTGIEIAAEIAEAYPTLAVRMVSSRLAAGLSARARTRVRRGLKGLGVEIVDGVAVEVGARTVVLDDATVLASALTLYAAVDGTPNLATRSGLTVDGDGRALVDEFLRSVDDARIFVVGDCAAVPGARRCCAAAVPQGAHAARALARVVKGQLPEPYSMGFVGQSLSLGRRDAVVQSVHRDDTARNAHMSGRPAVWVKELACRYGKFGARSGLYAWASGPR